MRNHGDVYAECVTYEESDRELSNPDRGFYHMHGFRITEQDAEYHDTIQQRYKNDDTALSMIEINLLNYAGGPIGETGLLNIERLFGELDDTDKNFIVRFLYDWDGKNLENEPEKVDIILGHMRQLAGIINIRSDRIFLLQGLFIGNCGEMNNTVYNNAEDMKKLSGCLHEVMDPKIFLAVRTPLQWRRITDTEVSELKAGSKTVASRLGLFNDGMLGNWTDCGTYGGHTREKDGFYSNWVREEELVFQDELCRIVPNGGEVILDNKYNDFENAVKDLRTMHVTYINRDYDRKVQEKWQGTVVRESGCFDGMDGLTFIERHLGYRILIDDTDAEYDFEKDMLTVEAALRNVGFAPMYRQTDLEFVIRDDSGSEVYKGLCENDIRTLAGGNEEDDVLNCRMQILLSGISEGSYQVYFTVRDHETGREILMANTADMTEFGYPVAGIEVESTQGYVDRWLEGHYLSFLKNIAYKFQE